MDLRKKSKRASYKEQLIAKALTEKDEDKQTQFIRKMSRKLSTSKLKRGYRNLKNSTKHADIVARTVMKEELERRGERV